MSNQSIIIQDLESEQLKKEIPDFRVGDTIRVHIRIVEGDKERTQVFAGTVIARKGGGLSETFTLHRISYGEGVERVFVLHSPRVGKIEIVKRGRVRRSKLYYLRGRSGKAAKVQERLGAIRPAARKGSAGQAAASEPAAEEATDASPEES